MFDDDLEHTPESNYPIETDTAFTPDEIEAIKQYKQNLQRKLNKNRGILTGLESAFWGNLSYCLARFIVLNSGTGGVFIAITICLILNNIIHRDLLEGVNINYNEGLKTEGMGKLIKFVFSTAMTGFVIWASVGDLLNMANSSKQTYNNLQNTVEEFNRLPDNQQNTILIVGGILGLAGIYAIYDTVQKR